MSQPSKIVAVGLVVLLAAACTGRKPNHEGTSLGQGGGNVGGCRLTFAKPRRGEIPAAVDAVTKSDVWVVGARYVGGTGVPYAERWNGTRWDSPPVETVADANAGFHDVAGISRDDAWAVGWLRAEEPMIQRWDGAAWTSVTVPPVGSDSAELFGVAAPDPGAAWAVGRALDGRRWRTLILRWDGGSWSVEDSPTPPSSDAALRAVDGADPRNVWAVGWSVGPDGRYRTLALHFDGVSWRTVRTPNPGAGDHVLSSVVASGPNEAWAVGWSASADGAVSRALLLRWDGHRWRETAAPPLEGNVQLTDVAAAGPHDVWAVGRVTDRSETFSGLLLRWDGATWSRVGAVDVGPEDDTLSGVDLAGGSTWGVGTAVTEGGMYDSLVLSGC